MAKLLSLVLGVTLSSYGLSSLAEPSTIPESVVGVYSGQGAQNELTPDKPPCRVTSRKFLSIEISADGTVRWRGHDYLYLACPGDTGAHVPRSCWTEGTGTIAAGAGGTYTLSTVSTATTPGPAIYDAKLNRWRCGAMTFDIPVNQKPMSASCVRLGPVDDYKLESLAAAQCEYGEDFEELKETKFKIANGQFKIPITLARKSSVVMQRVQVQTPPTPTPTPTPPTPTPPPQATQPRDSACPPGTVRFSIGTDNYEDFCWTSQFQKHGPYEMKHANGDRDVGQYDHGKKTGTWTYFGKVQGTIRFENDLAVEGKTTRSSDGSLRLRIETVDGVTTKTWFHADGTVEETERYRDGKRIPNR